MNLMVLLAADQNITISSTDIANNTGKQHKNVCRDIRYLLEELELVESGGSNLSHEYPADTIHTYKDTRGKEQDLYLLRVDIAYNLLLGYSAKARQKCIEEIQRLCTENKALRTQEEARELAKSLFSTMTEAISDSRDGQAKSYHYSNEANMINRLAFGMTAKDFRKEYGHDPRSRANAFQLEHISKLEEANALLIELGVDYKERKAHLTKLTEKGANRLPSRAKRFQLEEDVTL